MFGRRRLAKGGALGQRVSLSWVSKNFCNQTLNRRKMPFPASDSETEITPPWGCHGVVAKMELWPAWGLETLEAGEAQGEARFLAGESPRSRSTPPRFPSPNHPQ